MKDVPFVVLVVDDEPGVLAIASLHLQRAGYTVLEAIGGAAALSVLESRSDVALVLIDCDMPGMSGPEADKIILARWPHIRIIAMSGRPPAPDLPDEVDFIPKPFKGADLVARVRNVLNH